MRDGLEYAQRRAEPIEPMDQRAHDEHRDSAERASAPRQRTLPLVLTVAGGAVVLTVLAVGLSIRAAHRVNRTALAEAPRPVTVAEAQSATYRDSRTYVGEVAPWVEANIGPQFISAYVETVLVRPGAVVKEHQVLATLDCTHPSAATRAVEMQARAVAARMRAASDEAARVSSLLDGGFVAPNEAEQKDAVSAAARAQLLASQADLLKATLDVRDCVLRAPFDGEIATRTFDPGALVRPGASIVSVVDRSTVRVTVDATEKDFDALAPGTMVGVDMLAIGAHLSAPVSRRAPGADPKTRTVHVEVDIADPNRRYPVGTTAIVRVDVGAAQAATAVPIYCATQESGKAQIFVVEGDVARQRRVPIVGESGGTLYFTPQTLAAGARVVTEGRELLSDGDRVAAKLEAFSLPSGQDEVDAPSARGGGFGRPL